MLLLVGASIVGCNKGASSDGAGSTTNSTTSFAGKTVKALLPGQWKPTKATMHMSVVVAGKDKIEMSYERI